MKAPKFQFPQYQAIPLSPDDLIQVESISSTFPMTLDIEGTCMNNDGNIVPFQSQQIISAGVTPTTTRFRLGYLFLLSCVVHCRDAGVPDGSCFTRVTLVQDQSGGFYPNRKLLTEGYISTYASIGYGSNGIQGIPSDHFFIENIAVADPAAGANVDYQIPDYTELKIISLSVQMLSDANVASRQFAYRVSLPPAATHNFKVNVTQNNGANYNYIGFLAAYDVPGTTANSRNVSIPEIILYPGCTLSAVLFNIQVGDQFSDFSILALRRTIPFA